MKLRKLKIKQLSCLAKDICPQTGKYTGGNRWKSSVRWKC